MTTGSPSFRDLREDGERRGEADPARAFGAGAVRLVERRLKDEPDAKARSDLFESGCHLEGVRPAFHLTGTGKKRKRQGVANANASDLHDGVWIYRHPKQACFG